MCGIYGIFSKYNIEYINYKLVKGMQLLQHRGQDSNGIAYYDSVDDTFILKKEKGKVNDNGCVVLAPPGTGKSTFIQDNLLWKDQDILFNDLGIHSSSWHDTKHTYIEEETHYKTCDSVLEEYRNKGQFILGSLFWEYVPDAIVIIDEKEHERRVSLRSDLSWEDVKNIRDFLIQHAHNHNVPVFTSFEQLNTINKLQMSTFHSNCCLGHLRYSTSGKTITNKELDTNEIQPLKGSYNGKEFLFCHNGNIPKIHIFDSKYILNTIMMHDGSLEASLINLIRTVNAAYSCVILFKDKMYLFRDRYGIRPLCYGKIYNTYHVSSESCALTDEFEFIKDVEPGQIIRIDNNGHREIYRDYDSKLGLCTFELLYFSNENSIIDGYNVKNIRSKLSKEIAKKDLNFYNKDYCVIGIPLTGILLGEVYAKYLSLDYKQYITKNIHSNRTFIECTHKNRIDACKKKFIFNDEVKDKKIIIVDDTIVRGNVISTIIKQLRELKVKEVHVRIPSAPVIDVCYLGISIKSKNELISYNNTQEEICEKINADSLKYLSLDEMKMFMPKFSYNHCFTGKIEEELLR